MLNPEDDKRNTGCLGAPFVWASCGFQRLRESFQPGIPFPDLPLEGVIVATVIRMELGQAAEELTVHLSLEENRMGITAMEIPAHKQPRQDASWYDLKEGNKIQLKYKQQRDNRCTITISAEPVWW